MNNPIKLVIVVVVVAVLIYAAFVFDLPYSKAVRDFVSCEAAGYPIMESYPRQCRDKDGNLYVEEVTDESVSDMVRLTSPVENAVITSPVSIRGEARGPWYFEASFPIEIRGADGAVLGNGIAQAEGEWMTTEFVPFAASVRFDPKGNTKGSIRLIRDNPSGDPQRDAYLDITVRLSPTDTGSDPGGGTELTKCRPTGCSGQICGEEDIVSTCEFRPEYACYKTATCERQADGLCGWINTPALASCLANPPQE